MRNIIAIYDNTKKVSEDLHNITGDQKKYGDVLFKKELLKNHISNILSGYINEFFVFETDADCQKYLSLIKNYDAEDTYLIYINSCVAFESALEFQILIEKLCLSGMDIVVNVPNSDKCMYGFTFETGLLLLETLDDMDFSITKDFINLNNEEYLLDISKYENFVHFLQTKYEVRFFNSIEDNGKYLIKRSENVNKINSEYFYYKNIPSSMKIFYPYVFDFVEGDKLSSYKIEKFNIPDLSIQYISNSFDSFMLNALTQNIFDFIDIRHKKEVSTDVFDEAFAFQYKKKVNNRLDLLKTNEELFQILNNYVSSGTKYDSIDEVFELYNSILDKKYKKFKFSKNYLTFSHGDLCFSNILYDRKLNIFKLIDPKGGLKEDDLFLDPFYDVVKLSHSILGNYDFINNGMYETKIDNLKLLLSIEGEVSDELQKVFTQKIKNLGFDLNFIRLLESSLFLSMLPLHSDNPSKVLALLLNGINILEGIEIASD